MSRLASRVLKNDSGATAIEYGLIAALIAAVLIGTLGLIGSNLNTKFGSIAFAVNSAG